MRTIFGVSSTTPLNRKLKNGYTMYDWVKRQKCFPAFCMRTISGENKITAEEIEFLKAKDCGDKGTGDKGTWRQGDGSPVSFFH